MRFEFRAYHSRVRQIILGRSVIACIAVVCASFSAPVLGAEIDFEVGQSAPGESNLVLRLPESVFQPFRLASIPSGEFAGFYMSIEPGWDGLGVERTEVNLFPLTGSAEVELQRVRFDDEFRLFDLDGNEILESDGDRHTFAGQPESNEMIWHEHLIFAVGPDADASQTYSATFRLVDPNGVQGDSDDFTLTFQPTESGCGGGGCGAIGMTGLLMSLVGLARFRRRL